MNFGVYIKSVLTYPKNLECSLTILGEKGTVKLGGPSLNKFLKWEFEDMKDNSKNIESKAFLRDFLIYLIMKMFQCSSKWNST